MASSVNAWNGLPVSCGMECKTAVANIRTYDEEGYKQRSACVCFRDCSEQEVLLVTSSSDPHCWVVPGGGVEPQESPCCAARRELQEEAGAIGAVHRFVGVFTENEADLSRKTKTYVFTLNANVLVDCYEDSERIGRQRKWFSLEDALRELRSRPSSLHYLTEAVNSTTTSKCTACYRADDLRFFWTARCNRDRQNCTNTANDDGEKSNLESTWDRERDRPTVCGSPCKCGFRKQREELVTLNNSNSSALSTR